MDKTLSTVAENLPLILALAKAGLGFITAARARGENVDNILAGTDAQLDDNERRLLEKIAADEAAL